MYHVCDKIVTCRQVRSTAAHPAYQSLERLVLISYAQHVIELQNMFAPIGEYMVTSGACNRETAFKIISDGLHAMFLGVLTPAEDSLTLQDVNAHFDAVMRWHETLLDAVRTAN